MEDILILCVEDEREVLDAILRDIKPFEDAFRIEAAEDVPEARSVLIECEEEGLRIGLILCDHVLPGESGVDFLAELHRQTDYRSVRKVLITGEAGHQDTIKAINEAGLHHYIAKPWQAEALQQVVRRELTDFVIAEAEDFMPYVSILDGARLMDAYRRRGADT